MIFLFHGTIQLFMIKMKAYKFLDETTYPNRSERSYGPSELWWLFCVIKLIQKRRQ